MTDRPGRADTEADDATQPDPATDTPGSPASTTAGGPEAAAPRRLCPYLIGRDGDWRAAMPLRDHRCAAVDPPAALSAEKQRRLCLVPEHRTCSTFLAARRALVPVLDGETKEDVDAARPPTRWPLPRTAPVLLERDRGVWLTDPRTRSLGQAALVALMATAFLALIVARSGDGGAGTGATPGPSPDGSPAASAGPTPTTSPSPSSGGATAAPTSSPTTASPSTEATTYVVKSGDTLSGIAALFGTTVAELVEANDISDPAAIRVGQTLIIP